MSGMSQNEGCRGILPPITCLAPLSRESLLAGARVLVLERYARATIFARIEFARRVTGAAKFPQNVVAVLLVSLHVPKPQLCNGQVGFFAKHSFVLQSFRCRIRIAVAFAFTLACFSHAACAHFTPRGGSAPVVHLLAITWPPPTRAPGQEPGIAALIADELLAFGGEIRQGSELG